MRRVSKSLTMLALAAAMASSAAGIACEAHYRVYDPYYTDYHTWDNNEVVYYNQWTTETHRDPHRDFRKLDKNDQKEYWTWRHNHDHDHDHH